MHKEEEKTWSPKNVEIIMQATDDVPLSKAEWDQIGFPFHDIPNKVETHVNTKMWRFYTKERTGKPGEDLMKIVLKNLIEGRDSGVGYPGNIPTMSKNSFDNPSIDIPRIADSLATEIKAKTMAGPFPLGFVENSKVNGFLSIVKPGGARRQVGNLASPAGSSFNEGISEESMKEWRVFQLTSKDFSHKVVRAGKGAIISCSDMVSAYKTLPVCIKQRRLQVHHFLGKEFMDLRLVFGDKKACSFFDRFHECIIRYVVITQTLIPEGWGGKTVDDVSTVAPSNSAHLTRNFVNCYRTTLEKLNIKAAPEDPTKHKAFDGDTCGEVLGIWFDSSTMTWSLPIRKLAPLVNLLLTSSEMGSYLSLHDLEVLEGKLCHISQLAPPLSLFTSSGLLFMRNLLETHLSLPRGDKARKTRMFPVPEACKRDFRILAAILRTTADTPLSILHPYNLPQTGYVRCFSDASGHILASPSLGVYVASSAISPALVASLSFPRSFLNSVDEEGNKMYCKTNVLESQAYLATLMIDPLRFIGQDIVFGIDNTASILALRKGYSKDYLVTTLVRAARVVAAGISSHIHAVWTPRRSSRETRIADNLSHNLLEELTREEVQAYVSLGCVSFPEPVLQWMRRPGSDDFLGSRSLEWMFSRFPGLSVILEKPK